MPEKNRLTDLLLDRASTDRLVEPAPSGEMLALVLSAALRAPDHGRMRPWRFVTISGKNRAGFADLLVEAMQRTDPDVSAAKLEKRRDRYREVPMTIVLGMTLQDGAKIPVHEQVMAAAAGYMNVLNALHAEGFGAIWVSGVFQNDPEFRRALGFSENQKIAGFLQVGMPSGERGHGKRPDISNYFAEWGGSPAIFGADQ